MRAASHDFAHTTTSNVWVFSSGSPPSLTIATASSKTCLRSNLSNRSPLLCNRLHYSAEKGQGILLVKSPRDSSCFDQMARDHSTSADGPQYYMSSRLDLPILVSALVIAECHCDDCHGRELLARLPPLPDGQLESTLTRLHLPHLAAVGDRASDRGEAN